MKKKCLKYVLIAIVSILLFLLALGVCISIPLLIDNWAFGSDYPSNIENKDWAGFLGSYTGSLLGGIVTLVGIWVTIKFQRQQTDKDRVFQSEESEKDREFQRQQANEDRRLAIAPYLIFNVDEVGKFDCDNYDMLFFFDIDDDECTHQFDSVMKIKNIGAGPCLNIKINNIYFNDKKMHDIFDTAIKPEYEILEKNNECFAYIALKVRLDKIRTPKSNMYTMREIKGILSLKVNYNDLMENTYIQYVEIDVNTIFDFKVDKNEWVGSTLPAFNLNKKRYIEIIKK
ncbi:hypothetical protein [Clostridium saccharoperbutylacetonicum]|uniref:hypothetical protein n=1 Tax=Clostridium saccharoperbutylacetonicum TaxID=36745 RepID=UPI000986E6D3|nr:hypothetical protein [Clostridium saccharoperbutylacetonicum]NSB34019.1 hypothetical protein [Clostridium saccharoperbutylacetonicum]